MVCEFCNQASLEELRPVLNAPFGARWFLIEYNLEVLDGYVLS